MSPLPTICYAFIVAITIACAAGDESGDASGSIVLERASFKLSKVEHGEKVSRVRVTTDAESADDVAHAGAMEATSEDTLSVQASFLDTAGNPAFPEQVVLRVSEATGKKNKNKEKRANDVIFVLARKGLDMRLELSLRREIKADPDFWRHGLAAAAAGSQGDDDAGLRVEVVMADARLDRSRSWVVTNGLVFSDVGSSDAFRPRARGVFDFDVGVKQAVLPEFDTPLPQAERRAPLALVMAGLATVAAPIPLLAATWARMGVLGGSTIGAPTAPGKKESPGDGGTLVLFQLCVAAHMAALAMFWLQWNIVTTWKVMGVLMIPTVIVARNVVAGGARR